MASLEKNQAVPQIFKCKVIIWPSNSTRRKIPKGIENVFLYKNLNMFIATLFTIAKKSNNQNVYY